MGEDGDAEHATILYDSIGSWLFLRRLIVFTVGSQWVNNLPCTEGNCWFISSVRDVIRERQVSIEKEEDTYQEHMGERSTFAGDIELTALAWFFGDISLFRSFGFSCRTNSRNARKSATVSATEKFTNSCRSGS